MGQGTGNPLKKIAFQPLTGTAAESAGVRVSTAFTSPAGQNLRAVVTAKRVTIAADPPIKGGETIIIEGIDDIDGAIESRLGDAWDKAVAIGKLVVGVISGGTMGGGSGGGNSGNGGKGNGSGDGQGGGSDGGGGGQGGSGNNNVTVIINVKL